MMALVRLALLIAAALLVAGCPSKQKDDPKTWDEFFDRYCDYAAPCCVRAGFSGDADCCRRGTDGFEFIIQYSPLEGAACLRALDSGAVPSDFCADRAQGLINCLSTPIDSRPLGAECQVASECALPVEKDSFADCFGTFPDGSGVCQQVLVGREGDSPCRSFDFDNPSPPEVVYDCRRADGIFCNRRDLKCTRLAMNGEPCWEESMCIDGSFCSQVSAVCTLIKPDGDPCGGEPFRECGPDASCDRDSMRCLAFLKEGASCGPTDLCTSRQCKDGRCTADLTFAEQLSARLCSSDP